MACHVGEQVTACMPASGFEVGGMGEDRKGLTGARRGGVVIAHSLLAQQGTSSQPSTRGVADNAITSILSRPSKMLRPDHMLPPGRVPSGTPTLLCACFTLGCRFRVGAFRGGPRARGATDPGAWETRAGQMDTIPWARRGDGLLAGPKEPPLSVETCEEFRLHVLVSSSRPSTEAERKASSSGGKLKPSSDSVFELIVGADSHSRSAGQKA